WHAQRLFDAQPLYPPPTLDFVPHPYPPLYPAVVALLAKVAGGVSYALGRVVSTASFAGALAIGWRFVRVEGGSRAAATVAMAIPCAAYAATGAWYDLVRVDSLWLLLTAGGATLAWRARRSTPGLAAAAMLLVAAFFTKQTAAPFMVAVSVALFVVDRRAALVFVAALALVGLPALWAMQHATDGWFWFYIARVHRSHRFYTLAALLVPGRVLLLLLPALPLVACALWRDRAPQLRWSAWLALVAIFVSAVGKATAGGFINAFIPGIYFSSLLVGVALARTVARAEPRAATRAWALAAATVLLAPRVVPSLIERFVPADRPYASGYALSLLVPTAEARARDEALLARLRAVDGDVWLPSRPWYARLAGKRPLAGEMAAADLAPTAVAIVGFDEALRARPFVAVVVDDEHDARLAPLFERSTATRFDGAATVVGERAPTWWLTPR
ncbi:MAG: hypothetical protein LC659_14100, partial [Myxococcales bacterium]|nr:hypothetical protein [Myxococcales bacterium]